MPDILSQKEIDALLEIGAKDNISQEQDLSVDISKQSINAKAIDTLHAKLANFMELEFSSIMNSLVKFKLYSVEQITYDEFLMLLPKNSQTNIFSVKPLSQQGVFSIDNSLAFSMLDVLLGGYGEPIQKDRDFSDIECDIFAIVLDTIVKTIEKVYKSLLKLDIKLELKADNTTALFDFMQTDITMFAFEVNTGNNIGMINIYYPSILLEMIFSELSEDFSTNNMADKSFEVDLCEIKLNYNDVLNLKVGDVIKIDDIDKILKIYIDGKYSFGGKIDLQGLKRSVYITHAVDSKVFADG